MHTLTADDLSRQPLRLLDDAQRGEPALVTRDGEPVLLAVPLGKGIESREVRLEVAVNLFDREQISIGLAARIAGISVGKMIDECGKRQISVIRVTAEELERELAAFGD
jgi:predicted HTH domain antitoxin